MRQESDAFDANLREALAESRQRYKDLVEISSDFAWEVGPEGTFVFVSSAGALGWSTDDMLGRPPAAFLDGHGGNGERMDETAAGANPFVARYPVQDGEVWFKRADGTRACLSISMRPIAAPDGAWRGARGICRDVTEDRERDAALARAHGRERLFGYIIRTMRDEIDPRGMMKAAARAISRALTAEFVSIYRLDGDRPCQAAESGEGPRPDILRDLLDDAMAREGAIERETGGGIALAVATQHGGATNGGLILWRPTAIGAWNDDERSLATSAAEHLGIAIEQVVQHEKLQQLSRTDGLTGLLNRRSFVAGLVRRHGRVAGGDAPGALVYCDLDNFKQVNDTHGHERGDAAICALARLLEGSTRGGDLVARLGGDEFALWLEATDRESAVSRAQDLLARASLLDAYSGSPEAPLGISLGIAIHTSGSAETVEALMVRADKAMYASKQSGKGQFTIAPPPDGADATVGDER
ncbi:MAG: diguanylate cyclase [Alphaproteobacteria bacterium]|nr:diguanylate cyclase [Alphaproteobacteria bacterium]